MPRKTRRSARQENDSDDEKPAKRAKTSTAAAKSEVIPKSDEIASPKNVEENKEGKSMLKFVGAQTSIAGGIQNAVTQAVEMGATAFALFLRSQRTWKCKPLEETSADLFKEACAEHGFSPKHILPHGSYLLNLGSPDAETLRKSREGFLDEMQRCEKLGLCLYNFHPGSSCGKTTAEECCQTVAESINGVLSQTSGVTAVIENMAGQGNTVGGRFEEIRDIIAGVEDKSRVGVCIDTCHAFAAGFDIRKKEGFDKVLNDFDQIVGLKYLKGMHLNDSKGELGCHLDRHENIGKGKIGIGAFQFIMNDPRLNDIPLILETPMGVSDADEVKLLFSF
ncbi:probable endonuclease 4 [Sycon ciliatum]|uniref:probable endonuclease 4 n=1 Tax=Sycon ciliatum TaxID=27933 RepID=UPI0031F6B518